MLRIGQEVEDYAAVQIREAAAQAFPQKPVKLVVGFAAGGITDTLARIVAESLTADLGQPVLVENRAGGAGGTCPGGSVMGSELRSRESTEPSEVSASFWTREVPTSPAAPVTRVTFFRIPRRW